MPARVAEGRFFPDTYRFAPGTSDVDHPLDGL